jgi:hypothetical protein
VVMVLRALNGHRLYATSVEVREQIDQRIRDNEEISID